MGAQVEVSIEGHVRVSPYHEGRTWFGYIWTTMGVVIPFTMGVCAFAFYLACVPAFASEGRVVRGPGNGYYEPSQLSGLAGQVVKDYLDVTYVDCEFETQGKCNLNARTEFVDILYVNAPESKAAYALAFIYYSPDTGNAGALRLAVWRAQGNDGYKLVAAGSGMNLSDPKAIGVVDQTIVLSGLTLGPDETRCCLTDPTVYKVSFANGKLSVAFTAQMPLDGRTVFMDPDFPKDAVRNGPLEAAALRSALSSAATARSAFGVKGSPSPLGSSTGTSGYMIPTDDASPISIVQFLTSTKSPDLEYVNDNSVMRRVLARHLLDDWLRAQASAKARGVPFYEGNWVTDELEFNPGISELHASFADKISADMKDKDGNVTHATFEFVRENRMWKVSDVVYAGVMTTRQGVETKRSLLNYCDDEIGKNVLGSRTLNAPSGRTKGFDSNFMSFAGEAPYVFFHNGSEMMLFPNHGIIAYKQPKDSIADVVHEADILFSGKINKAGVVGTAFVFKKGCPALPYRVTGAGYSLEGKNAPSVLVLRGQAPVHARNSCAVVGTMANGANNVLRFEPAGAYAEDALEEESHSGYGYEHGSK